MKKYIAGAMAGAALLASVVPAFGHGMGAGGQRIHPEEPSCVGQLAAKHAVQFHGIAHTNHVATSGLPHGPNLQMFDTVQDFMHGVQAYCGDE